MAQELSTEDAKTLLALCVSGRLYAIEAWVQAGRSLQVPRALRKTPLDIAITTGFHSLIELLLRHAPSQQAKDDALRQAVQRRRPDVIELAVTHGAEIASVPFVDVLGTADKRMIAMFLDKGADAITQFPFAHAFHELRAKTTLGTYLDCKRQHPELADKLQEQADMALREFCRDGNLKWVSLLMWAGADPRSLGPRLEYADDPEMHTTAFHEACTWGHTEILKRLKPDPTRDDLASCEQQMARLGLTVDGRRKSDVKETRAARPSPYVLASYDREKLYKEVWAEPTQKVAERYGISDVALAKGCRQLQIPKPPRGYWAKKAAGQPVPRRPKLLPLEAEAPAKRGDD